VVCDEKFRRGRVMRARRVEFYHDAKMFNRQNGNTQFARRAGTRKPYLEKGGGGLLDGGSPLGGVAGDRRRDCAAERGFGGFGAYAFCPDNWGCHANNLELGWVSGFRVVGISVNIRTTTQQRSDCASAGWLAQLTA